MGAANQVFVRDVMSTPLATISKTATVREAAARMGEDDISALFVPAAEPGIITTTDVTTAVANGQDPAETVVQDVMTAPVERVTTEQALSEAAAMLENFGIKHLPVIDTGGDYVGMISTTDLAAELV